MVALQYSKVHRSIMLELALPREERIRANDMLKMVRDQLDRLHETSPQVPDVIIADFKKHFGDTTPDVSKPDITNGLDPIEVYVDEENRKVRTRDTPHETKSSPVHTPSMANILGFRSLIGSHDSPVHPTS